MAADAPMLVEDEREPEPMSDAELKSKLANEIRSAVSWLETDVWPAQEKGRDYYDRKPFGNEQDGRSKVVLGDVAEAVDWMMPPLMRMFTQEDRVIQYEPQGPEDEEGAKQASEYAEWVFFRDNPGYRLLHDAIKTSLIEKTGVLKSYWDTQEMREREEYEGLTEIQYAQLLSMGDVEVIEESAALEPTLGIPLYNCTVERVNARGRAKVRYVPNERFLIDEAATCIEDATFAADQDIKSESDLIDMGFDPDQVKRLPHFAEPITTRKTGSSRNLDQPGESPLNHRTGPSRMIAVTEAYWRVDYDGDGRTELRHIIAAGNGENLVVLSNEPADRMPYSVMVPLPLPGQFHGQSVFDLVGDIQLIKSTLVRGTLDTMNRNNQGRWGAVDGRVNLSDLLSPNPGGVVRMKSADSLIPLPVPPFASFVPEMLAFFTDTGEKRTGINELTQGVDAQGFDKTASGLSQVLSQVNAKVELIARNLSENGLTELFGTILELVSKHQDQPRIIRLRNKWVPMDPSGWSHKMDVKVQVGLGTSNQERMIQQSAAVLELQKQLFAAGLTNMVSPREVFNAASRYLSTMGIRMPEQFILDPEETGAPEPPPEDPAMVEVQRRAAQDQAEVALKQEEIEVKKRELVLRAREIELEHERELALLDIKRAEVAARRAALSAN